MAIGDYEDGRCDDALATMAAKIMAVFGDIRVTLDLGFDGAHGCEAIVSQVGRTAALRAYGFEKREAGANSTLKSQHLGSNYATPPHGGARYPENQRLVAKPGPLESRHARLGAKPSRYDFAAAGESRRTTAARTGGPSADNAAADREWLSQRRRSGL
jgi:hypothetical protein